MARLDIKDLHVKTEDKQILNGLTLTLTQGEVAAIMGPNGSGKSTLANVLLGNPRYTVTKGDILFDGESILGLAPNERAARGLFLSFQYPSEIPGVTLFNFLRAAQKAQREARGEKPMRLFDFTKLVEEKMAFLKMDPSFKERYLNEGFSGGEKKRAEILQLLVFEPRIAILDETDSGLDIDALKIVAKGINAVRSPERSLLLITHYQRILGYVVPDTVHILKDGRIAKTGGPELAHTLEEHGYEAF